MARFSVVNSIESLLPLVTGVKTKGNGTAYLYKSACKVERRKVHYKKVHSLVIKIHESTSAHIYKGTLDEIK